jgi:hypothetical protein
MPNIPYKFIFGEVENIMQRNRQLDSAKIAGQMTAGVTDRISYKNDKSPKQVFQAAEMSKPSNPEDNLFCQAFVLHLNLFKNQMDYYTKS